MDRGDNLIAGDSDGVNGEIRRRRPCVPDFKRDRIRQDAALLSFPTGPLQIGDEDQPGGIRAGNFRSPGEDRAISGRRESRMNGLERGPCGRTGPGGDNTSAD